MAKQRELINARGKGGASMGTCGGVSWGKAWVICRGWLTGSESEHLVGKNLQIASSLIKLSLDKATPLKKKDYG